ncbi:DUF3883 domain-containing protein [Gordonia tangerina]|uniref:DUF3883 domain-containing protein n=1 Tax=Gordonia tangerina TaxID=2911060 RepID=A0ABS9DCP6_9ACTN|nr:DUF3883 domain-containing protein [Gordonia tangerina]MCF3936980.1 DUF3883 domain-containing protein [Gordonia tangerina]
MAGEKDWSRREVELCVAEYLHMLTLQLNGQNFNKRARSVALAEKLNQRSRTAVEFKHCNISAVMTELGYPLVQGYKPRSNYQRLLIEVLEEQLSSNSAVQDAAQAAVQRPATPTDFVFDQKIWVPAPEHSEGRESAVAEHGIFSPMRRDFLAQESRNRSLGLAGETLVVDLEVRRLYEAGKKSLSERVEHVSQTLGDGLGYDVLSFDDDGRERLIEVKTTAFGRYTPFYVTRNELARSEEDAPTYHLYRVFDFRENPKVFDLPGAIGSNCRLDAATYLARVG